MLGTVRQRATVCDEMWPFAGRSTYPTAMQIVESNMKKVAVAWGLEVAAVLLVVVCAIIAHFTTLFGAHV